MINKPLQFRFMVWITITLLTVSCVVLLSLYFGIWGGILDAFSDEGLRSDLLTASRLSEYESARLPHPQTDSLSFFKQAEKLSQRQREVFKGILDATNRRLLPKFLALLLLIAWGSIYLSHKIAGPLYRVRLSLDELGQGNLRIRIHLRKTDEAQFLGTHFNQAVEHLDLEFCRIKNIVRENESNPERMVARLKEELSKIKTSADRENA